MKAVNPGFTLAICTLMGLETSSPLVVLSIVMISVGTAVATLVNLKIYNPRVCLQTP